MLTFFVGGIFHVITIEKTVTVKFTWQQQKKIGFFEVHFNLRARGG